MGALSTFSQIGHVNANIRVQDTHTDSGMTFMAKVRVGLVVDGGEELMFLRCNLKEFASGQRLVDWNIGRNRQYPDSGVSEEIKDQLSTDTVSLLYEKLKSEGNASMTVAFKVDENDELVPVEAKALVEDAEAEKKSAMLAKIGRTFAAKTTKEKAPSKDAQSAKEALGNRKK